MIDATFAVTGRTSHALLRLAIQVHGLTDQQIVEDMVRNNAVPPAVASAALEQFHTTDRCPIVVGVAIVGLIAEKDRKRAEATVQ